MKIRIYKSNGVRVPLSEHKKWLDGSGAVWWRSDRQPIIVDTGTRRVYKQTKKVTLPTANWSPWWKLW